MGMLDDLMNMGKEVAEQQLEELLNNLEPEGRMSHFSRDNC